MPHDLLAAAVAAAVAFFVLPALPPAQKRNFFGPPPDVQAVAAESYLRLPMPSVEEQLAVPIVVAVAHFLPLPSFL